MKSQTFVAIALILLLLPYASALEPSHLWSYSDTCAVFSMALNENGTIGLAFGYYAELLSPNGKLLWKVPTRGIAYSSALSDDDILLIGTEGRWVQAFKDGKVLWEMNLREAVVSVSISQNGSVAVAGDASGRVYLFRNGKLAWEKRLGNYTWSVLLWGNKVLVGSDSGLWVISSSGQPLWRTNLGPVRKVLVVQNEIVALLVPQSELWSELVAFDENGKVLWKKKFSGYARAVDTDGKGIAVAGNFGNVTLFALDGRAIYSVPLIGYAYDVGTRDNYTLVSYGKTAELVAPNGTVVWFQRFNGTAYHVAFSPKGYFLTEYSSHDVQNCYSVIEAWSLGEAQPTVTPTEKTEEIGFNPYVGLSLLLTILLLGVLLWRKR
ncbi:PQQ-binding-like beta-propeller repeat protein [Thermococcus sp.]|uniref:outer membrane protein assembly factor BamB family protein n=1 Tax=Thermococcus sp. TaxID=35749 RepID=UPI0026135FBA|nr:PQQ-binding-like beta-propeller repeat protein [Thermococcus sp.]